MGWGRGRVVAGVGLAALVVAGGLLVSRDRPPDTAVATRHPSRAAEGDTPTTTTDAITDDGVLVTETSTAATTPSPAKARTTQTTLTSVVPPGLLARIEGHNLVVSAYDGSARRILVSGTDSASVWAFGWSPDRQLMGYVRGPAPYFPRDNTPPPPMSAELGVVRLDGSLVRIIDRDHVTSYGCCNNSLNWSPDGTRLMYPSNANGWMVARVAGGDPVVLPGGAWWAPDGASIAAVQQTAQESWRILITDRDGGGAREVVADGANPKWSPDSTKIAYEASPAGEPSRHRVHTVDRDGKGDVTLLADGAGGDSVGEWSPDGAHLIVERNDGTWGAAADGMNARRVVDRDGSFLSSRWINNATIVTKDSRDALVAAPLSGGTAVQVIRDAPSNWLVTPARDWIVYADRANENLRSVTPSGVRDALLIPDAGHILEWDLTLDGSAVATLTHSRQSTEFFWTVARLDGRGRWNILRP